VFSQEIAALEVEMGNTNLGRHGKAVEGRPLLATSGGQAAPRLGLLFPQQQTLEPGGSETAYDPKRTFGHV